MAQSVTVSFRCRGELKEWLESYAEEQMMTTSLAAQQIISQRYQDEQAVSRTIEASGSDLHEEEGNSREEKQTETPENSTLRAYNDYGYRPRSNKYDYAVEMPDDKRPKYYKTERGAIKRLKEEYGELGEE